MVSRSRHTDRTGHTDQTMLVSHTDQTRLAFICICCIFVYANILYMLIFYIGYGFYIGSFWCSNEHCSIHEQVFK